MSVLNHDNGCVHHRADRDCDPAKAHDVGAEPEKIHAEIRDQHAERQRDDGDQRAANVKEEQDAHKRDDQALFNQGAFEVVDRAINQIRTVVDRFDRDALRKTWSDLGEAAFDVFDDGERVLAEALQSDTGDDLALSVHLGDAAPLVGCEFNSRHVLEQHGYAPVALDDDLLEVGTGS